jgi:hypothetical protein
VIMNLICVSVKYLKSIRQMIVETLHRSILELRANSFSFVKILYHETCLLFLFFKMRRLYLIALNADRMENA